jgi:hypothetical protein
MRGNQILLFSHPNLSRYRVAEPKRLRLKKDELEIIEFLSELQRLAIDVALNIVPRKRRRSEKRLYIL